MVHFWPHKIKVICKILAWSCKINVICQNLARSFKITLEFVWGSSFHGLRKSILIVQPRKINQSSIVFVFLITGFSKLKSMKEYKCWQRYKQRWIKNHLKLTQNSNWWKFILDSWFDDSFTQFLLFVLLVPAQAEPIILVELKASVVILNWVKKIRSWKFGQSKNPAGLSWVLQNSIMTIWVAETCALK